MTVTIRGQRYGGKGFYMSLSCTAGEPGSTIKRLYRQRVEWCEAVGDDGRVVGGVGRDDTTGERQWWSEH